MAVFPAGHILTSNDFDLLFPTGIGAWTPYTPTLVQSNSPTKTGGGVYCKVGRWVNGTVGLSVTSNGTATNEVRIGLPVAAATTGRLAGEGFILDSSAGIIVKGLAFIDNVNYVTMLYTSDTTGNRIGAAAPFTAALASGDQVQLRFSYEAAA